MTRRTIARHLIAVALVIAVGVGLYLYHSSPLAVSGLTQDLDSERTDSRIRAAERLGTIGAGAAAAAPQLLARALDDPNDDAASTAAAALLEVDLGAARQAVVGTLPRLADEREAVRRRAAVVLGSLGALAEDAVPALAQVAANDPVAIVRDRAVGALGRIGLPIDVVLPALVEALGDEAYHVRHAAVAALTFTLPAGACREVLPILAAHPEDEPAVTQLMDSARRRIEKADDTINVEVLASMTDRDQTRAYALHRLAILGPRAALAAPVITPLLAAKIPLHRYLAATALGLMGEAAAGAVPALRAAQGDADPVVQEAVARALVRLGAA